MDASHDRVIIHIDIDCFYAQVICTFACLVFIFKQGQTAKQLQIRKHATEDKLNRQKDGLSQKKNRERAQC